MKWLCGGLTFVNCATVCGLLLGMIRPGLNGPIAVIALVLGMAAAVLAYLSTSHGPIESNTSGSTGTAVESRLSWSKYRNVWTWILAGFFTIFAIRSFCWLLYVDADQLRIQSPNNLGDIALHITHINYFANGVALWPANPIYVFSNHLRYPAGLDLFNALLSCTHVDLIRGLVWVGLLASVATFYAFYRWGGAFTIAGFLFNGGIVGLQFVRDFKFVDYQDVNQIAWKSVPLTMFVTQRGLLYAIPAGLLLIWHWREKYFRNSSTDRRGGPLPFGAELLLYASMPLFHLHTFVALTIVLVCFLILGDPIMRGHIFVLLISALIPATFFTWLITDHFHARSVLEWHPGWVQNDDDFKQPFFRFWFLNFGILGPLVLTTIGFSGWRVFQSRTSRQFDLVGAIGLGVSALCVFRIWKLGLAWIPAILLLLALGILSWAIYRIRSPDYDRNEKFSEETVMLFAAMSIFVVAFFVKFAPWGWDNLKILIWAYFLVLPLLWTSLITEWSLPMRVVVCLALFMSGFVSLFGGLSAGGFGFIDRAELDGTGNAVAKLPIEARFATYPTYNHPVLLQGRKVALGYLGHLWTQGFDDYGKANELLTQLMQGSDNWRKLAHDLQIHYIFWGREEKQNYGASKRPWEQTAALVSSGNWGAIYDLDQPPRPLQP